MNELISELVELLERHKEPKDKVAIFNVCRDAIKSDTTDTLHLLEEIKKNIETDSTIDNKLKQLTNSYLDDLKNIYQCVNAIYNLIKLSVEKVSSKEPLAADQLIPITVLALSQHEREILKKLATGIEKLNVNDKYSFMGFFDYALNNLLSCAQMAIEYQSGQPEEEFIKNVIKEMNKRPIGLLDVDGTLIPMGDTKNRISFNQELLEAYKEAGIKDLYLFTNMDLYTLQNEQRYNFGLSRPEIIVALETQGFTVHGVITPLDIGLYAKSISEVGPHNLGVFYREQYLTQHERLKAGTLNFQNDHDEFFANAKEIVDLKKVGEEQAEQLVESFKRDQKNKEIKFNIKAVLYDFFLTHKPDWVGAVVYADDEESCLNSVNWLNKLREEENLPLITMQVTDGFQVTNGLLIKNKEKDHFLQSNQGKIKPQYLAKINEIPEILAAYQVQMQSGQRHFKNTTKIVLNLAYKKRQEYLTKHRKRHKKDFKKLITKLEKIKNDKDENKLERMLAIFMNEYQKQEQKQQFLGRIRNTTKPSKAFIAKKKREWNINSAVALTDEQLQAVKSEWKTISALEKQINTHPNQFAYPKILKNIIEDLTNYIVPLPVFETVVAAQAAAQERLANEPETLTSAQPNELQNTVSLQNIEKQHVELEETLVKLDQLEMSLKGKNKINVIKTPIIAPHEMQNNKDTIGEALETSLAELEKLEMKMKVEWDKKPENKRYDGAQESLNSFIDMIEEHEESIKANQANIVTTEMKNQKEADLLNEFDKILEELNNDAPKTGKAEKKVMEQNVNIDKSKVDVIAKEEINKKVEIEKLKKAVLDLINGKAAIKTLDNLLSRIDTLLYESSPILGEINKITIKDWDNIKAIVNQQNDNGDTLLHSLAKKIAETKDNSSDDLLLSAQDLMRNYGADPTILNKANKSAISFMQYDDEFAAAISKAENAIDTDWAIINKISTEKLNNDELREKLAAQVTANNLLRDKVNAYSGHPNAAQKLLEQAKEKSKLPKTHKEAAQIFAYLLHLDPTTKPIHQAQMAACKFLRSHHMFAREQGLGQLVIEKEQNMRIKRKSVITFFNRAHRNDKVIEPTNTATPKKQNK